MPIRAAVSISSPHVSLQLPSTLVTPEPRAQDRNRHPGASAARPEVASGRQGAKRPLNPKSKTFVGLVRASSIFPDPEMLQVTMSKKKNWKKNPS